MDVICWRRKNKSNKPLKSILVHLTERYIHFLDSVMIEKSYGVSKIIEFGCIGGTIIVKNNDKNEEISKFEFLEKNMLGEKK